MSNRKKINVGSRFKYVEDEKKCVVIEIKPFFHINENVHFIAICKRPSIDKYIDAFDVKPIIDEHEQDVRINNYVEIKDKNFKVIDVKFDYESAIPILILENPKIPNKSISIPIHDFVIQTYQC